MNELDLRRVLEIVRPTQKNTDACRREVICAIQQIQAVLSPVPGRQLLKIEDKLRRAHSAINELPLEYLYGAEDFLRELARVTSMFAQMADATTKPDGGGRDRAIDYRRKVVAAHEAFDLLLYRGRQAPRLMSPYFDLTAALFEMATGKLAGDVETACEHVIKNMKKQGYRARNLSQYRAFMARYRLAP